MVIKMPSLFQVSKEFGTDETGDDDDDDDDDEVQIDVPDDTVQAKPVVRRSTNWWGNL